MVLGVNRAPIIMPGGEKDPNFASVSLLVPGSADFSDKGPLGHTPTVNVAVVSSAQTLFGNDTMKFDAAGTYVTYPNHSVFQLGSGEWTIEYHQLFTSLPGSSQAAFSNTNPTALDTTKRQIFHRMNSGTSAQIFRSTDGINYAAVMNPGITLATLTWYHMAWVRDGNIWRLYQNGVQIGSASAAVTLFASTGGWVMGQREGIERPRGHFANYRVTKGICRYPSGSTFTPPSGPYPTS